MHNGEIPDPGVPTPRMTIQPPCSKSNTAHLPLTHPFFTGPPYPLSIIVNQVSSPKIPNYNIDNEWLSAVKQSTSAQYINAQLMNASIFNP